MESSFEQNYSGSLFHQLLGYFRFGFNPGLIPRCPLPGTGVTDLQPWNEQTPLVAGLKSGCQGIWV